MGKKVFRDSYDKGTNSIEITCRRFYYGGRVPVNFFPSLLIHNVYNIDTILCYVSSLEVLLVLMSILLTAFSRSFFVLKYSSLAGDAAISVSILASACSIS